MNFGSLKNRCVVFVAAAIFVLTGSFAFASTAPITPFPPASAAAAPITPFPPAVASAAPITPFPPAVASA